MIRALARVNVTLGGGNGLTYVTLKSVSLSNYRTKGYLWPALSNYSNENDQAIAPTFSESVTPISNVALTYNALSQHALLGSVYLTETDNNISNRLCVVI